ncbi:MAG: DUF4199 domain-containing protein [Balneolaceae bacterium]
MKSLQTELKWALIFAAMTLMWMTLERVAGLHGTNIHLHPMLTNLFAIPAIVVMILALRDKRRIAFDGAMTYKQGLLSGTLIALFIAILSPGTQWITSSLISPHYFSNVIAYSVEMGYYPSAEAAAEYFNYKSYAIQSAVGALIWGILTSAIAMIFLRSRTRKGDSQMQF